jgi:hypothetical protein
MLRGADETKLNLSPLERWHCVTVDQRDLSLGVLCHSIDAGRCHKVTRFHDELLHQNSIQNDAALSKAKSLRRGLVEGPSELRIPQGPVRDERRGESEDAVSPGTFGVTHCSWVRRLGLGS